MSLAAEWNGQGAELTRARRLQSPWGAAAAYAALALALIAVGLWGLGMLGRNGLGAYPLWLSVTSLATFVLYGVDKAQAKRGGLRVPENLLHGMALLGGFPGGFAGRAAFHHKTRKPAFAWVLWISLAIHLVVVLGVLA